MNGKEGTRFTGIFSREFFSQPPVINCECLGGCGGVRWEEWWRQGC